MIVCAWCHGAIADDGRAAIRNDICAVCLPPMHVQVAEALARAHARQRRRQAIAILAHPGAA